MEPSSDSNANREVDLADLAGVEPKDRDLLCAPPGRARPRRRRRKGWYLKQASKTRFSPPVDPRCGTWLNESFYLSGLGGARLLESVLLSIGRIEQQKRHATSKTRFRARSQAQQRNFERRIECILANALRTHFYRKTSRVAYYRRSDGNRGKGQWMSATSVGEAVDLLADAGFISKDIGVWKGTPGVWDGYSSTFWPVQNLLDLLAACNGNQYSFAKRRPDKLSLIKLRPSDREERNLSFEWTNQTMRWADDIDRYNRFIAGFEIWIDIDLKHEKWLVNWCNANRREGSREPHLKNMEYFNRFLVRIFNDGTFDHGGRLYGAWYQYVPSWLRKKIVIDTDDTVELDFSCMSLRMLYHRNKIDYREDAYAIPALAAYAVSKGHSPRYFRDSIKKLVQAMLNNEDDDVRPEMIKLDEKFGPRFTRAQVKDMILAKHHLIKDAFGTGIGKELQRLDSDLALEIIVSLMDQGIPCLPIHDSFVVAQQFRDDLRQQMTDSYKAKMGFDPVIHQQ